MIIQQSILLVKTSGGNFRRSLLFGILRYENFYDFFAFLKNAKAIFLSKLQKSSVCIAKKENL